MPEKQVYQCDKTEGIEISPKTKHCLKAISDESVSISLSISVNGVQGAADNHIFCGVTHANFWLKRQRVFDEDEVGDDQQDEASE